MSSISSCIPEELALHHRSELVVVVVVMVVNMVGITVHNIYDFAIL